MDKCSYSKNTQVIEHPLMETPFQLIKCEHRPQLFKNISYIVKI